MANAITQQLEAARAELKSITEQLAELERRRDVVAARVEAFELSAQYIEGMSAISSKSAKTAVRRRNRLPSSDWQQIFGHLNLFYDDGFRYDDILEIVAMLNIQNVQRASLRAKMMNYVNDGYVDRVDNGRFRLTEKGKAYFDVLNTEKEGSAATAPSDSASALTAPENHGENDLLRSTDQPHLPSRETG